MSASHAFDTQAWLQQYPSWVDNTVDPGEKTLVSEFRKSVQEHSTNVAMNFFGATLNYKEFGRTVDTVAQGLFSLGVHKGSRVVVSLPNCPQHLISVYAILSLGATVVEHNPLYTAAELLHPFEDHQAAVAIVWDKVADVYHELKEKPSTALNTIVSVNMTDAMPVVKRLALALPLAKTKALKQRLTGSAPDTHAFKDLMKGKYTYPQYEHQEKPVIKPETPALLLYTSGTTGKPKGAQLTHRNIMTNIAQGYTWIPDFNTSSERERLLAALPFFHVYGFTLLAGLGPLIGGEIYIVPSPEIPLIVDIIKKYKPTWIPGVPPLYSSILEAAKKEGVSLRGIKNSFSGASTLPVELEHAWQEATGGRLVEGYGLTETSPILLGNPMDGNNRAGYVGLPFPGTLIKIVNPDDPEEIMPDGEAGEIMAKGGQVFHGYINLPEVTQEVLSDGWFRTGDMGIMDSDGFVRLVSRIKEMIITGGFNVYPVEVETVLKKFPNIDDASVVGVPQEDGSEKVVAVVTFKDGAKIETEQLRILAKKYLTPYKVPQEFYHFDELPRDQMGKIRRRDVQAMLLEKLENSGKVA